MWTLYVDSALRLFYQYFHNKRQKFPPQNAHLLLLLDLGEELLVNDILLQLLCAACDQYQHAVVLCVPLEEIHVCFHN